MGRKTTPHNLRVIAGTDRKDRAAPDDMPEFEQVKVFPDPPVTLNVDGAEMWNNLGPQLVAQKVLQVVDLYALEQLCYSWQRFRQKARAGIDITASEDNAMKSLMSEFGMTPAARRKVANATQASEKNNPFAGLGAGKPKAPK